MWVKTIPVSVLVLFVLFLFSPAYSQEEFVIGEGELSDSDLDLQKAQAELNQFNQLSIKLDEMMQTNVENMESLAAFTEQRLSQSYSNNLILTIVIVLAALGLHWAIKLNLISRGLLKK